MRARILTITLLTLAALSMGSACADDSTSAPARTATSTSTPFVSPVAGGYRFVGPPLPVIVRQGDGTTGAINGFRVAFRLNRALPRGKGTPRAYLEGDSGFPAAYGIGVSREHCYTQAIDGGPGPEARAGDLVTVTVRFDDRRTPPLSVRVPLVDELPRIVNDLGMGVGDAAEMIRLGCASKKVKRWGREQGFE